MSLARDARLSVRPLLDQWVECADLWVHVARDKQPPAAKPPPETTAKPPAHLPAGSLGLGRLGWAGGQPEIRQSAAAAPVPSEPPVGFIVSVRNERATQVRMSFASTAVRVAIANLQAPSFLTARGSASWTSVAPGQAIARHISVPSASGAPAAFGAVTAGQYPPSLRYQRPAFQGAQIASMRNNQLPAPGGAGGAGDRGIVAFQYPARA